MGEPHRSARRAGPVGLAARGGSADQVETVGKGTSPGVASRGRGGRAGRGAMSGLPDSTIARARLGDAAAFAELVRHYYPRALRFARNMLGDLADAEDAVQEAFLRVHAALPRYAESGRFEAWLFRIVANQCRSMRARERRRGEWLAPYEPRHDAVAAAAGEASDGALRREIDRALHALPSLLREAFLLHYVEGLGYDEMTAVTGARASALKMRVKRARDLLRARLEEVQRA